MVMFDRKFHLAALSLVLLGLGLEGCVVASVAGAAVGTTAKVAGTAIGITADAAGAAGRAVTGSHSK